MAVTIDLTPEQEYRLRQEAAEYGMSADEYAKRLLTERLAAEKPGIRFASPGAAAKKTAPRSDRVRAARGLLENAPGSVEAFLRGKHREKVR